MSGEGARAADDKAPEAFRTISEVAEELGLPQHVLRFWETRFTQIKPLKRGGGRRYYRPDDVELLRAIRVLLYEQGLTIKGVQKMLREQGAATVRGEARMAEPGAEPVAPSSSADVSELREALEDLREAARLLEAARRPGNAI